MNYLIAFFGALLAGFVIISLVHEDPGYVLVTYRGFAVETAMPVFIIVVLIGYISTYYLWRVVSTLWFVKRFWGPWQKRRHQARAIAALEHGLTKTREAKWQDALIYLSKGAKDSENPLLHYLYAADAAQLLGDVAKRDKYLRQAYTEVPSAKHIIALTEAELMLKSNQIKSATKILEDLRETQIDNAKATYLLLQCYYNSKNWKPMTKLLKELRGAKFIDEGELEKLEIETHENLLKEAHHAMDPLGMSNTWINVPLRYRNHEALLPYYIEYLFSQNVHNEAEQQLYRALKRNFKDNLIYYYGLSKGADPALQLRNVEEWLRTYPHNAVLLQAAGRICVCNRLWGKARAYYEAAVGAGGNDEIFHELGELLEQMGAYKQAIEVYKQGLGTNAQKRIDIKIGHMDRPLSNEMRLLEHMAQPVVDHQKQNADHRKKTAVKKSSQDTILDEELYNSR